MDLNLLKTRSPDAATSQGVDSTVTVTTATAATAPEPSAMDVQIAEAQAQLAESVSYSSHPIPRFGAGPWQFVDGLLNLSPTEAEIFDKFLATCDARTTSIVKKIDYREAEARFLERLASQQLATKANDSSANVELSGTELGTQEIV